jgi:hypothetical protein
VAALDITISMSASQSEILRQCAVRAPAGLFVQVDMTVSLSSYFTAVDNHKVYIRFGVDVHIKFFCSLLAALRPNAS